MLLDVGVALLSSLFLQEIVPVTGLGSSCSGPLGSGTAGPEDPYWQQQIQHQGSSAFGPDGYQVFRNVKDFGAKGDGMTDDTAAINAAISSGGRCGPDCPNGSSSTTPATVFIPQGTYMISSPIQLYYYTELVGDARNPPTLRAISDFVGIAIVDADPGWFDNTDNFYRSVRNFVLDTTRIPSTTSGTGIHWQVAQATSLYNVVFNMNNDADTAHQGIWMENGSGGLMADLVFNGGKFGMWVGNQQFTARNITVNNANTAIFYSWGWSWTFQDVTVNNCQIAFDSTSGSEALAIIDATITNTPIFVRVPAPNSGSLAGSLVLNNVKLNNVPTGVISNGQTVLNGGTTTINSWAQGNVFTGLNAKPSFLQDSIGDISKANVLLDSSGKIFGRGRPAYADYAVSQFVSVKSQGAHGDGHTDDTTALQKIFDQFSGCKIIYFDAGTYIVSSTLTIPADTQIVGEAWSNIMGSGQDFQNQNIPQAVIRVGASGSTGTIEISGIVFTTQAPANGAIVVEWNVHDPAGQQGAAGAWDTIIRLGAAAGTNIQNEQCSSAIDNTGDNCFAAFMGLHLTSGSSAYLEGLWVWLGDHDLDGSESIELMAFSGRGILSESQGPVWMIGTAAEHNVLYQYNLAGAANHYMGLIQTETAYYQPNPVPPSPFISNLNYHDPVFSGEGAGWALYVQNSSDILVFGGGLYSFFSDFSTTCEDTISCQQQLVNIDSSSSIGIYSFSTIGAVFQLSVDHKGVIPQSANPTGFAQVFTAWTQH